MTDETTGADSADAATSATETSTVATTAETATDQTSSAVNTTAATKTDDAAQTTTEPDWRRELSGDDEKFYKQLSRYQSKEAFGKAHKELVTKLSAGEFKQPLKEGASETEVAEWRKANGIPETPDKYDLTLPDGLVVGEDDKKEVSDFLARAHKVNASPEFVKTAVASFLEMREAKIAEIAEQDESAQTETISLLKEEWGSDYKLNKSLISDMMASAPNGLGDSILRARMPDGTLVGNHPDAARFFAGLARELNPVGTILPAGAESNMQSVESEMKELESKMGTKSYTDADRQRYIKLTEVKEKAMKKAG